MKLFIKSFILTGLAAAIIPLQSFADDTIATAPTVKEKKADTRTTINGVVTDASTKKPIDGATVKMRDVAAYSKDNGSFRLKVNNPLASMTVSAPGYLTREVEWRGRDSVFVAMTPNNFSPSLTAKLKVEPGDASLVPATAAMDAIEDIELTLPQQTFENLLQERMGTVRVTQHSGTAGMGADISIRGVNSIEANTQPLVLVDGIPFESYNSFESLHSGFFINGFANIDVRDIENITVIKDAVSIYGSKAANGVILIETVRGHDPVTRITANIDFGFTEKPKTLPMLNAEQSRILASELYRDNLLYTSSDLDDMTLFNDKSSGNLQYNKFHNQTDWTDWVYNNTGINQGYSARATGGDAVGMYALSVGYVGNSSTVKESSMNHLNFRFNSDIKIAKVLRTAVDFNISSLNYTAFNDGVTSKTSPTYLAQAKSPVFYPYTYSALTSLPTTNYEDADALGINNPVSIIEMSEHMSKQTNFVAVIRPVWDITKDLHLQANASYGMNKFYEAYFTPMAGVAPETVYDEMGRYRVYENEAKSQSMRDTRTEFDVKLSYNKDFDNHHLDLLGGWRYFMENRTWDMASGYNTGQDNQVNVSSSLVSKKLDGENRRVRSMNWYLTAGWNYREKYFLNAAVSMDASSRFGTEVKGAINLCGQSWGLFPSVQAAWLMSAEDFMAGADWLDVLKLRASYGLTGNDGIKDYITYSYFELANYIGAASGLILGNLGNPYVKWETTRKANIGADLSFFQNHLSATVDFYQHKTSDLLVQKSLRRLAGFDTYWANDGDLSNKGFEVSLNARLIDINNFRWELSGAVSRNINRVEHLANGDYTTDIYGAQILTAEGQPIGVFYGYKYLGVYSTAEQAATAYQGKEPMKRLNENTSLTAYQAGDAIFEDVNGDGIISDADKQIIGDPNPDVTGMVGTTFSYKGVSLNAIFTYSLGNDMYNYQRRVYESMSTFDNQTTAVLNRWRSEGQVTNIPQATYGDPMGNSDFSTRWIEDASYIRLKSLTLRWDLPFNIKVLKDASVFATAYNPFVWTRYLGCDPETSVSTNPLYQGIDAGLMPQSRSYVFGVRLKL